MTRSWSALVVALALAAGCTEALRVPPPTDDTAGAAGAPGSGYASATPAMGGGLVGGSGVAASPGSGFGPGTGGSGGHAPMGGMAATSGMGATSGTGTAGMATFPTGPMPSPGWTIEGHTQSLQLPAPAIGMSRDGTVVLAANGMLWQGKGTAPASLIGTISTPKALNGDGTAVIGDVAGPCPTPVRWTIGGQVTVALRGSVSFVSADGGTAAGVTWDGETCGPNDRQQAFLWQSGTTRLFQPVSSLQNAAALGLSDDGLVMIGRAWDPATPSGALFRLSVLGGVDVLATPPFTVSSPVFMSANGSAFAGTGTDASGNLSAFVWSLDGGFRTLPKVAGRGQSLAFGLSSDGTVVAALGTNAPAGLPVLAAQDGIPFRWTAAGGAQVLSTQNFESLVMAPDATSIVGNPSPNVGAGSFPVRWDQNGKPYTLLPDAPMLLATCRPIVTQVSADVRTLAGACDADGRKAGFIARF